MMHTLSDLWVVTQTLNAKTVNTPVSFATKPSRIRIQARSAVDIRVARDPHAAGTPYWTVKSGDVLLLENLMGRAELHFDHNENTPPVIEILCEK